jgi:hypothetical protein
MLMARANVTLRFKFINAPLQRLGLVAVTGSRF